MTSTLAILGRFSGDKAKAMAYCDDLIATYSQCREEIAKEVCRLPNQLSHWIALYPEEMTEVFDDRRASVTDTDYRWK